MLIKTEFIGAATLKPIGFTI